MNTVESREKIGFPNTYSDWTEETAIYDLHTLRIAGHPVMEDWELEYMEALASVATKNGGIVLELGYGMGLSARAVQNRDIQSHYIIECHPQVIQRCISTFQSELAKGRMHVLSGFWQEVTPLLSQESFDGILFDTYPLSKEEIHSNHFFFFKEAYRLLKKGGILTYYSDEATGFSKEHMEKLLSAGFKRESISFEICGVTPPDTCEYWQDNTLIVPIVRK